MSKTDQPTGNEPGTNHDDVDDVDDDSDDAEKFDPRPGEERNGELPHTTAGTTKSDHLDSTQVKRKCGTCGDVVGKVAQEKCGLCGPIGEAPGVGGDSS